MENWKKFWIAVLTALIVTLMLSYQSANAEIKNGYGKELCHTQNALSGLRDLLLDEDLTKTQRKTIKGTIKMLESEIAFYTITEILIGQFKAIAPELYYEINSITDKEGRSIDVYIRFVPWNSTDVKAKGTTNIRQSSDNEHIYVSEYGKGTVSVKIWAATNSFFVLAHELGHVKYMVPNLATYMEYYDKKYSKEYCQIYGTIGHELDDPSGKSAHKYESIFKKRYLSFQRRTKAKVINPLTLLVRVTKMI